MPNPTIDPALYPDLVVVGKPGSGKTFTTDLLVKYFDYQPVQIDRVCKSVEKLSPNPLVMDDIPDETIYWTLQALGFKIIRLHADWATRAQRVGDERAGAREAMGIDDKYDHDYQIPNTTDDNDLLVLLSKVIMKEVAR